MVGERWSGPHCKGKLQRRIIFYRTDIIYQVWDITVPSGGNHISRKPVYTLHTSFPVRRVAWRPNYECELAVTSYLEGSANSQPNPALDLSTAGPPASPRISNLVPPEVVQSEQNRALYSRLGDPVEVWDVRRGYIAKWSVPGSSVEGGVTGWTFTHFMESAAKRIAYQISHSRIRILCGLSISLERSHSSISERLSNLLRQSHGLLCPGTHRAACCSLPIVRSVGRYLTTTRKLSLFFHG